MIAKLALVLALLALAISLMALHEAGGARVLQARLRALESAVETARRETADTLGRLARALRGSPDDPSPPGAPPRR